MMIDDRGFASLALSKVNTDRLAVMFLHFWFFVSAYSPVEVLVCVTEIVAERPDTILADVVHIDPRLGHQDAPKHSQLHRAAHTDRHRSAQVSTQAGKQPGWQAAASATGTSAPAATARLQVEEEGKLKCAGATLYQAVICWYALVRLHEAQELNA